MSRLGSILEGVDPIVLPVAKASDLALAGKFPDITPLAALLEFNSQ